MGQGSTLDNGWLGVINVHYAVALIMLSGLAYSDILQYGHQAYCRCLESNEMLKLKFRKLHKTMVDDVDPVNIIDFLFQEGIIMLDDMRALRRIKDDPKQQCIELLSKLHASKSQQAFVKLYLAIKEESHLQWLIERIDNFDRQSLIDLVQQLYINNQTGEFANCRNIILITRTRTLYIENMTMSSELVFHCFMTIFTLINIM